MSGDDKQHQELVYEVCERFKFFESNGKCFRCAPTIETQNGAGVPGCYAVANETVSIVLRRSAPQENKAGAAPSDADFKASGPSSRGLPNEPAVPSFAPSHVATSDMVSLTDVRKLLCERCRAGYPFYGDTFNQHIVPGYNHDTYLNCRATEKLRGVPLVSSAIRRSVGTSEEVSTDRHDEHLPDDAELLRQAERMQEALLADTNAGRAERQLDAIAAVLELPKESWRIAGCDVLAHTVHDLQENYIRLRDAPFGDNIKTLCSMVEGLHSMVFGVANIESGDFALKALKDGGSIHEYVHSMLRLLPPRVPPLESDGIGKPSAPTDGKASNG